MHIIIRQIRRPNNSSRNPFISWCHRPTVPLAGSLPQTMQPLADERHCSSESKARILALSSLRYQNLSAISLLGLYMLITRESSLRSYEVVNAQQQSDPNDFPV